MTTHPHGETLSAFIDDMLDVAQMRSVGLHLRTCPDCRAVCASLQETRALLHGLEAPAKPAADFWTNTYRQMRAGASVRQTKPTWNDLLRQSLLGTQRRWAAGAAAVAVLGAAIAGPLLNNGLHPTLQTRPVAAASSPDMVDFSALVHDHTQSAAAQPLADSDRQAMLSADADDLSASGNLSAEASGNGSFTFDAAP